MRAFLGWFLIGFLNAWIGGFTAGFLKGFYTAAYQKAVPSYMNDLAYALSSVIAVRIAVGLLGPGFLGKRWEVVRKLSERYMPGQK